jgi:hypothetical protein
MEMIKVLVGLEAETFVVNEKGTPIICSNYGIPHDNFPVLCEIRGAPGESAGEVVGNFMSEFYKVKQLLPEGHKFVLVDKMEIERTLYNKAVRLMAKEDKSVPLNIYGKVNNISNIITNERGEIIKRVVQAGLHIHVSAVLEEDLYMEERASYVPVKLDLKLHVEGDYVPVVLRDLYKLEYKNKPTMRKFTLNMLSKIYKEYIIKKLDAVLFSKYAEKDGKYRQKGMYETKEDGRIEYRSLPFNQEIFDDLFPIINTVFKVVRELEDK